MAKKMIIKGVGSIMAKRVDADGGAQVIKCGNLQDLKIDFNIDIEDIFGGDGIFAIDTLVKEKSIDVTATDAKFDLDAITLMMGSTVQEQKEDYVWVLNEQHTVCADEAKFTIEPEFGGASSTLHTVPDFQIRFKDSNSLLTPVDSAPSAKDTFFFDVATGKVEFHADDENKEVVIDYRRTETVDMVDILADEVPFPVRVIHHGSFIQKDGSFQGVETELYTCMAKGNFSIDAQRASASASQIQLKLIDPERADGKLGSIKRYNSTKRV